ncbi:nitronate monooxygenase [Corynebacterium durum]|uniref:nitronate monooxygenase n=1 Tax=Corynebacterium durum TaxID=61592 RepID=UPI0040255652
MMKALVNSLTCPIIAAPMAGGPSTPTLTDAAWRAGGFGFLAAGMLTPEALERQMRATTCPYGVNVFMPHDDPASFAPLYNYAARHGLSIDPTSVDPTDGWDAKMALILRAAGEGWGPRVVSFTFGLIDAATVAALHSLGVEAWVTIARADAVDAAVAVGVDTLVVQGPEAGGHRATWTVAEGLDQTSLKDMIRLDIPIPVVAAGGIGTPEAVREALSWPGVAAVACGTAFLLADEAGTGEVHRQMVRDGEKTAVTRAFSGRWARGVETQFMLDNVDAPAMYPHVNTLLGPLRKASAASGDPTHVAAWAGSGFRHAREGSVDAIMQNLIGAKIERVSGHTAPASR